MARDARCSAANHERAVHVRRLGLLGVSGEHRKDAVLAAYRRFISLNVKEADLFPGSSYDRLNRCNISDRAMPSDTRCEDQLAAEATVRRQKGGAELTSANALIVCGQYGDEERNSDPKIGFQVNKYAGATGAVDHVQNPVGLYIDKLDDAGWKVASGAVSGSAGSGLAGGR